MLRSFRAWCFARGKARAWLSAFAVLGFLIAPRWRFELELDRDRSPTSPSRLARFTSQTSLCLFRFRGGFQEHHSALHFMKPTLTTRIAIASVISGLLPALIVGCLAVRTASHMSEDIGTSYQSAAAGVAAKIDRNLFERYGDFRAFGVNSAVNDRPSCCQVGSESKKIAAAADRYGARYGFYLLSLVVDVEGRVVAVNDQAPNGKGVNT